MLNTVYAVVVYYVCVCVCVCLSVCHTLVLYQNGTRCLVIILGGQCNMVDYT